ncbi:permease of the major facilitator superfamily [Bifidobacterium sp. DSM 109958]|uniref:Permease of the major facilitator superfamily n=1 Tax=Bifidobacterium moraviense TaxID=2675323 RepID=A0A7Y0HZ54_9BIFI|nr:MFS transporter [Bifidobacterium sp. DSM 109958]NMN00068.1 permease of the major facilitator superfamily [Bifidobacterium sp. DSM 109958]
MMTTRRGGGSESGGAIRLGGAQAYFMWGMGLLGYVFAVVCRSSLSAAGIEAANHFHTTSTALSGLLYLQLFVYAVMQVPAGVLLDRFGARALISAGGVFMAAGQTMVALAPVIPVAVVGRGVVGLGDALVFISVVRLVSAWFPARQAPLMTQLTSVTGGLGQVISLYPFAWLLGLAGWEAAFLAVAGTGVFVAAAVFMTVRDDPAQSSRHHERPQGGIARAVRGFREALRSPGTLCGFFVHAVTWFPVNMLNQLWGLPLLLAVEGWSRDQASAWLGAGVLVNMLWGPVMGRLAGIHPFHGRAAVVYVSVGSQVLLWTVLLLTPGPHPMWFMALLLVSLTSGGPASNIAMDYVRDTNDPANLGSATGFANTGGFLSSAIVFLGIGMLLDAQGATDPSLYTDHAMRVASLILYPLWAVGLIGFTVMLPRALRVIRDRRAE